MARAGIRDFPVTVALTLGLGLALAGCTLNGDTNGATRAGGGLDFLGGTARTVERDVEAPDVFNMEEAGLWDGRPSLGGVWVAHPDVRDPERVMIRNGQNGEAVIGALFRRERDNPGPRFQISSEAANALGILPGQPTTVRVTALRLQRLETAPEAPQADADGAGGATAAAPVGAEAGHVEIATLDAPEEPRRGLLGLFRRNADPAPENMISEQPLAPASGGTAVPADPLVVAAAPAPEPQRGGLRGLFSRRTPDAAPEPALIPLAEGPAPVASAPVAVAAAQPAVSSAPQAVGTLDRPFVQIGIFSVEDNARNAQRQMQSAGLSAEIRRGQANDRPFWRVVVGPASNGNERGQILQRVQGLGFADAYAVVR